MMEIRDFVETANKDQLIAITSMAQWMQEKAKEWCNCPSKCIENCQLAKEMFGAFQLAGDRLQGE